MNDDDLVHRLRRLEPAAVPTDVRDRARRAAMAALPGRQERVFLLPRWANAVLAVFVVSVCIGQLWWSYVSAVAAVRVELPAWSLAFSTCRQPDATFTSAAPILRPHANCLSRRS